MIIWALAFSSSRTVLRVAPRVGRRGEPSRCGSSWRFKYVKHLSDEDRRECRTDRRPGGGCGYTQLLGDDPTRITTRARQFEWTPQILMGRSSLGAEGDAQLRSEAPPRGRVPLCPGTQPTRARSLLPLTRGSEGHGVVVVAEALGVDGLDPVDVAGTRRHVRVPVGGRRAVRVLHALQQLGLVVAGLPP